MHMPPDDQMPTRDGTAPRATDRASHTSRRELLGAAGAVGLAGLAGCTGYVGSAEEGIEYWTLFGGGDGTVMEAMVDEINQTPDYDLQINRQRVPWDQHYSRLYTSMVGGNPPDIAVMHSRMMADYQDSLVPMTDEIGTDPYLDEIAAGGMVEGEQLAVPLDTHPFGLYYNKDIFEEVGLDPEDPPNTPERFYEAANAIVENTDYHAFDYFEGAQATEIMRMLLHGLGGQIITEDYEPAFDTDEGHAVVTEMHDWVHEHGWAPADPTAGWDAWNRGEVGMKLEGSWHISVVREIGFDFGMTEPFIMPNADDPVTLGDSHMLIIPESEDRTDDQLADAIETVRLLTQELNPQWGSDAGHLPASQQALESDELRSTDTWDKTLETFYGMVENDQFIRPPAVPSAEEYSEEIYQALDDMRTGNMTPEEVIDTATNGVERVFERVA